MIRLSVTGFVTLGTLTSANVMAGFGELKTASSLSDVQTPANGNHTSQVGEPTMNENAILGEPSRYNPPTFKLLEPENTTFAEGVSRVTASPAQPKQEAPLLIPLPSAISSGLFGLAGVALLIVPRRIRRRLVG